MAMKRFLFLLLAGLLVLGADGKRKQKTLEIDGVRAYDKKEAVGRVLGVEVIYAGGEESNNDKLRVLIQFEDRKTKKSYWIEGITNCTFHHKNYETAGHGNYKCYFVHPKSQRLKMKAYSVEFGKMVGKEFRPLVGEYDEVENYHEITSSDGVEKWTDSEMRFSRLTYVN
ncbi:MAG: hypothetical protein CMF28_02145 [Kiritimatiellaceae bacterium]|nr:hypothetical protein [Kiritimatiellaceae bacterium]